MVAYPLTLVSGPADKHAGEFADDEGDSCQLTQGQATADDIACSSAS